MSRIAVFVYGIVCYLVFFAVFLYGIGFIGGFFTPTQLDGVAQLSRGAALAVDLLLLSVFAVQHSGMARPAFKTWLKRFVSTEIERSTYVLVSSLALVALFAFWQPIGGVLWSVTGIARNAVIGVLLIRLGAVVVHNVPHRSFRPVRLEASVATPVEPRLSRARVSYAESVQTGAPPFVHRLVDDLLGRADDDRCSPGVRARDDRLHFGCHPLGREGSDRCVRQHVPGLSCPHTDAHSQIPLAFGPMNVKRASAGSYRCALPRELRQMGWPTTIAANEGSHI